MAYDPALQGILIFGGYNLSRYGPDNDTWLFTNGQWENLTPNGSIQPAARWAGLMAWDPVNQEMVLFGGRNNGTDLNDTWVYGSTGWTQLFPTTQPSIRQTQFSVFAYDPTLHADYLYGGVCFLCFYPNYHNDSWTFVNGTWTNITASVTGGPTAPNSGAWDAATGTIVAYDSNRTDCTGVASTMSFNGTAWNVTGTNSSPGPVEDGDGWVYDSLIGGMLFFGGVVSTGCTGTGQTWSYVNGTWTNLTGKLSSSPTGRCCESMAYDPMQKVVVLLGGSTNTNAYVGDTWSFPAQPLTVNITTSNLTGGSPLTVNVSANVTGGAGSIGINWSFGDGTPNATTAATSHTYSSGGAFDLNVSVEDAQGREVHRSFIVRVATPLFSGASAQPVSGEAPVRVNFTGNFSGGVGPYTYSWSFGDGTTGSGLNTSHVYRAGGNYTARLTVRDVALQSSVASVNVSIADPLTVSIATSPSEPTGDAPFVVNFTANPSGMAPFSATWSFGDGTPLGSGLNVSHRYIVGGTFDANVTVTDAVGHEANATVVVLVGAPLATQASSGKTVGLVPLSVTFVGSAFGGSGSYSYSWSFGDGSNSTTGASPTHVYTQAGRYTAMLTTTDGNGNHAYANISIHAVEPAAVIAHASVLFGITPLTVQFTSSTTGGLGPLTYAWAFGDGATAVGENASHKYVGAHTYTAGVTVSDPLNELVHSAVTIDVFPTFVATLSVDNDPISLGQTINFTASALGGAGSPTYAWNALPPGCSATNGPSVSCTPTSAGTFNVSVVATDAENDTTGAFVVVTVNGPSAPGTSESPGPPIPLYVLVAAIVVGAALGAAFAMLQRRREPPTDASPAEPAPEAVEPGAADPRTIPPA
jgi:PKD repeat protein